MVDRVKKVKPVPAGAPDWMLTYGDIMTLLLCFFVILVSMSELKKDDKFQQVMESLRRAFGGYQGQVQALPTDSVDPNALIARLLELEILLQKHKVGDAEEKGIHGKEFRVTNVRDGIEIVFGGLLTFDRFSATVRPRARELIGMTADALRGYNTKILVRGHATNEALPPDSPYEDPRKLSFARAEAIARVLEENGVRRVRLVLVAVGDSEPIKLQAYTEVRRSENRRVEVLVTEDLIDEYAGSTLADDLEDDPNG